MTAISSDPAELDAAGRALAETMMASILNSGHDRIRMFDDLSDLLDRLYSAARAIADERACVLAEERKPGESIAAFTRRVGRLSEARMGDLLARGETLRNAP